MSSILVGYHCGLQNERSTIRVPARIRNYRYVHDAFKRNYNNSLDCIWHDPDFHPLSYNVKQNMIWNHRPVCTNNTFVLLMFFTYRDEMERRDLIRKYVKQGMIVDGKVINYVHIIAANETEQLRVYGKENEKWNDLLISHHRDIREEWPITVFDAYMWVRDYCKQAAFVTKVDGDVWVHLGNLVHYLRSAPSHSLYGGKVSVVTLGKGIRYKGIKFVPDDCPPTRNVFVQGGGNVLSQDLIPYINIGTEYLDYLPPGVEDNTISRILQMVGVGATNMQGYHGLLLYERLRGKIPGNAVFVHCRGLDVLKSVWEQQSSIQVLPGGYTP